MATAATPPLRVRRMIERGTLQHSWRPGRTGPTYAVLVRRSDVERVQQEQHHRH